MVYFILVQFLPKIMNYAAVILGGVIILVTAIILFFYPTNISGLKILAGLILLLFLLLIIFTIFKNTDSWRMHSIFLKHSTHAIKQRKLTILYIPLFFIILVAFVTILVL